MAVRNARAGGGRLAAALLLGILTASALPAPAARGATRDRRLVFVIERTTRGPSQFHLNVSVIPGERGGFIGSVYAVVRKGRVVQVGFGYGSSGGRTDDPTVYSPKASFDSCDVGTCDVGQTLEMGEVDYYIDPEGTEDWTHLFVAAWGRTIGHRFEGKGWTLRTARLPFRFVDGQDAEAFGASHAGTGAEAFLSASAPGGRYGSIAVGMPPCSNHTIPVASRGVGEVVLEGGVRPESVLCPGLGPVVDSWARAGTTWRFSGRAVGETTLEETRLFVLDLPKRLRSPLG